MICRLDLGENVENVLAPYAVEAKRRRRSTLSRAGHWIMQTLGNEAEETSSSVIQ
jgi:hypothetical protein